jgi:hypothetical protein
MAQYLLALYMPDGEAGKIPEERTRQVWAGVGALIEEMSKAGAFVFKSGLHPASTSATVVSPRPDGDYLVTDGPYAETKEHLAGFWIVDAADLDEALEWAKKAAAAEQRPIEVRPFFQGELDDAIQANKSDAH